MAISKEIQKSSEMKFDGKLIKVTYDIADVNGNEAWRSPLEGKFFLTKNAQETP